MLDGSEKYKDDYLWEFKNVVDGLKELKWEFSKPKKQKEKKKWKNVEKRAVIQKNRLKEVPDSIRDIAIKKYGDDVEFTNKTWEKYNNLWKNKPSFFPFFCACKWQKNLDRSWPLVILDFSKLELGWKVPPKAKAYRNRQIKTWKLYIINGNNSKVFDSPIWMWSITSSKWWAANASDWTNPNLFSWADIKNSNKSELWFSVVENKRIKNGSVWDYLVLEWKEEGINGNMSNNSKYAHLWTWSMWCVVAPKWARNDFFGALQNNGTVFTYAPNKDYLYNSPLL